MLVVKIPREQKLEIVKELQSYLEDEFSLTIGELAAESLLNFVIKRTGPHTYNQALSDVRTVLLKQMERLDEEIYSLEAPLTSRGQD